jgi:MoaA/NifB/PqqE/SkfB family radical SAM enzyme
MCSIWKRREKEMSLQDIEKVFTDLKKFGIHTIFLQGGDPLVKKEVFDVIEVLNCIGFDINIITNGILLDEKVLKKLDKLNTNGRITVTVSLDTLDKKKYKKIRGVGRFDVVTGNIKKLSKHKGLRGGLHATITSINYKELDCIRKFAHSLDLAFTFNTYNDTTNYAPDSDKSLTLKNDAKLEEIIAEMQRTRDKISPLNSAFINDNIRYLRGEPVGPCDAFVNSLRVTSEGKLTPCLEIPPVYDLKKEDINVRWNEWSRKLQCYIERCYTKTPCFYGCTRGLGSVKKNLTVLAQGFTRAMIHEFFRKGRLR